MGGHPPRWLRTVAAAATLLASSTGGAAEAASGSCDLEPWLAEAPAPGELGFHVICASGGSDLEVYRNGVATSSPVLVSLEGRDFREALAAELRIKSAIRYRTDKGMLQWKKQPWTVFLETGEELRPGAEAEQLRLRAESSVEPTATTLLLFEGGAWRWPTLRIGFERQVMPGITLTTVSRQPALFEVLIDSSVAQGAGSPAVSKDLLANVVKVAEPRLEPSRTEGKVDKSMRSSDQTFLSYGLDPKLKRLAAGTARLLRGHEDMLEDLQVVRYAKNQHYDAHRDYWDPREFPDVARFRNREGFWHMRHATLLWYLEAPEEGGETWFPRAHGGPIPYGEWMACDDRGAKVSPRNATAVLFYSLQADGDIDEFSWHSGCPVKRGVKWAANSWMANTPPGARPAERRPLRGGAGPEPKHAAEREL